MKFKKIIATLMVTCLLMSGSTSFIYTYAEDMPVSGFEISSITWQDPKNAVLIWPHTDNSTYRIFRCDTKNGTYALIGTSSSGSFRDATANYPTACYYKVQPIMADGSEGELSKSMQAGTNPQKVSGVTVLMYHNFVTEEDIKNGVEFEEYSISPSAFEEDLKYLKNNGYTTITSNDLIDYMHGKKPLPLKAVIISIDDGSWGVYKNAWPLLKKYRMKADFNIIGENVDAAWETTHAGNTRNGQTAPYCDWNELIEMCKSGEINLCSHSYRLHKYNKEKRIGIMINEEESLEDYTNAIKEDFRLTVSCITGWTNITPKTLAYPYSKRNEVTDAVLLSNTTYEILMAGDNARVTSSNYFVDGASKEAYMPLINRPCRMDQHPIEEYLKNVQEHDFVNGVNTEDNPSKLSTDACKSIAAWYSPFADVHAESWYSDSVYYAYVNSIMSGTSPTTFSPQSLITRGMTATLLHRLAGNPKSSGENPFSDVPDNQWHTDAAIWAAESNILPGLENGTFAADDTISRQQLAVSMYQYAKHKGLDTSTSIELADFSDVSEVSHWAMDAMKWAVAEGIFKGNGDKMLSPQDSVTRAQMATILHNWNQKTAN